MANPEHEQILRQGIEQWNLWRKQNPYIWPDLSKANLSKADLSRAVLSRGDLSGADLSKAKLIEAKLNRANLSGADLSDAKLFDADLSDANLSETDLSRAVLRWADLSGANLSGAVFSKAKIVEAKLNEAKLEGALFEGAILSNSILGGTDLGEVKGLESVKHYGPSTIGIDTFFLSKGKIPAAFLRGAGVPEIFLQYAEAMAGTPIDFYSCFISYSHIDKPFARKLWKAMQGRGIRCWLDEKQLLPGDHIHEEIDKGVRLWDKILLCCSKESLKSWWVDKEISKALQKEQQLWKDRGKQVLAIIPLNLDGYMFHPHWQDWKKQHLTDRLATDFEGWEKDNHKFEEQLEKVVKALRADGGAREQPPQPRL